MALLPTVLLFFFNDTATTEIYTLSLHDALPIFQPVGRGRARRRASDRARAPARVSRRVRGGRDRRGTAARHARGAARDRKSTRLNSSHANISYAVFCLKKKKTR